jgi:hypothetical protein
VAHVAAFATRARRRLADDRDPGRVWTGQTISIGNASSTHEGRHGVGIRRREGTRQGRGRGEGVARWLRSPELPTEWQRLEVRVRHRRETEKLEITARDISEYINILH